MPHCIGGRQRYGLAWYAMAGDGCAGKNLGGAFTSICHGERRHCGFGRVVAGVHRAARAEGNRRSSFCGSGGAFERVGGNKNAHAHEYMSTGTGKFFGP